MDNDALFHFDDYFEIDEIGEEKRETKKVNLDMWGDKTSKDHKKDLRMNKFLKPFRIMIMKYIYETLNAKNIDAMVYGGTALSVWRDKGKMIIHDHDIDLAIHEKDFLTAYKIINERQEVFAEANCPFSGRVWFNEDETEQILYDNIGVKRMKVYLKDSFMNEMANHDNRFAKLIQRYNKKKLCVDIFGLQKKPNTNFLRVTWNLPGVYDNDKKLFPEASIFPLKECVFEGVSVKQPNVIENYLQIEYGYLEKDARYDDKTQLYVKLTETEFNLLPGKIRSYMVS